MRLFCLLLIAPIAFSAPQKGKNNGHAAALRAAQAPEDALKLAADDRDAYLALAAFGTYLKQGGDPAADITKVARVARRRDFDDRAALLLASYAHQKVVDALVGKNDELAASILAIAALKDYLVAERRADPIGADAEIDRHHLQGKGQSRGKKGKGKGSARAATIPEKLFGSRDPVAVSQAILAAAYRKDSSHADTIKAVSAKSAEVMGAKILYQAMTEGNLNAGMVASAMKSMTRPRTAIPSNRPTLSYPTAKVPGICSVLEAIAVAGDESMLTLPLDGLKVRDIRVKIEAVRAMRALGSVKYLPILVKELPSAEWPLATEICKTMSAIPHTGVIPSLIKRLDKEKGRLRQDIVHCLSTIAGKQEASTAKEWADWWRKNQRSFKVDEPASAAYRSSTRIQDVDIDGNGFFYGLILYSDRMSYVVDSSASMRGGRIENLTENMSASVEQLKSHVKFNIVDFGGDLNVMYDGALTSDKRKAIETIEDFVLSLGTRSYDGMEAALHLQGVDTLFFLSDGAPIRGQIDHWEQIRSAMILMGRYRPVAVSAIDFDPSAGNQAHMFGMATENVGSHDSVEVGGGGAAKKKKPPKKKR
ncbi:MAG: hypothetical protein ACI8W8_000648 [Rhodothermales bacterium]|jgi:hypothetical protein